MKAWSAPFARILLGAAFSQPGEVMVSKLLQAQAHMGGDPCKPALATSEQGT
jgi:hypothetical protein